MQHAAANLRRRFRIAGQVQGVGFRPFVYRLATDLGLTGTIRNDGGGVSLELQGPADQLDAFDRRFEAELPALARIDHLSMQQIQAVPHEANFAIVDSDSGGHASAAVTIDTAVCGDCLRELFDPADRRHGYGLINCTNCGPRFSIIEKVPYDRPNTTMSVFSMCPACEKEYLEPRDRRFHAQPTCCPACGPKVVLVGSPGGGHDVAPYGAAAEMLANGQIVAIKGLGGFHLACRADSDEAVKRLRSLKHRDAKPFALMARDLQAARQLVELSPAGEREMVSPRAPIVLARKRLGDRAARGLRVSDAVAPGNGRLGIMLPYTPIHHLLFAALDPEIAVLVMTSGNISDEPLAIANDDALERLGPLCDAFLLHDRVIARPVDDSIYLDAGDAATAVRRSRGYAPVPIPMDVAGAAGTPVAGLCVGAELKNTLAVVRATPGGTECILSQHLGDLTSALAFEHFKRAAEDLLELFDITPQFIAHDMHPNYLSTVHARELAARLHVPLVAVQHHHAHAAAVLAEHQVGERALALVCDGTGYGPDGTIWGGEVLEVTPDGQFARLGRLKPIRLPGGDAAARDTRRPALALLYAALGDTFDTHPAAIALAPEAQERSILATMIRRGVNAPYTSSTGRLFDAIAALLGVAMTNAFEAQAPMALEALATEAHSLPSSPLPRAFVTSSDEVKELDLTPFVGYLLEGRGTIAQLSLAWHEFLAVSLSEFAAGIARERELGVVALSGGVFGNALLSRRVSELLRAGAVRVLEQKVVPANDGGVAFGQAAVVVRRSGGAGGVKQGRAGV